MKIYVANLAAYSSGELIGKWLTLPMEYEELKAELESIANAGEYVDSELAIHDHENIPFEISEYTSPYVINDTAFFIEQDENGSEIVEALFNELGRKRAIEVLEMQSFRVWNDCKTMEEVAEQLVDESFDLTKFGQLAYYIDYEAFGRDLDIQGTFIESDCGMIEVFNF